MGRTTRWFRSLIGGKKEAKQEAKQETPLPSPKETTVDEPWDVQKKTTKEKRRWSFRRSVKDQSHEPMPSIVEHRRSSLENFISEPENRQNMHAIAVAAATAATADAAVAAAQAAAAVVRLTSNGCSFGCGGLGREEGAAIRIQTAFRGYLARRALCALKSLVKLQALIRGHIVRKQAAATLRCMQALVRIQARVRARRVRMSEEGQAVQRQLIRRRQQEPRPRKSTEGWNASTHSVEDQEAKVQKRQAAAMKRERALAYAFSQQEIERRLDESAKIVEMDTGRPKTSSNNRICSISEFESAEPSIPSITSATRYSLYDSVRQSLQLARSPPQIEGQLASPLMVSPAGSECVVASALQGFSPKALNRQCEDGEDSTFSTAQSSPQYFSAVSKAEVKRGPLTPYRPEYANNFFQDYSAFPNYMANTESSKAKVRSQSAPKQRPDSYEKTALPAKKRMPSQGAGENWSSLSGVRMQRSSSQVGTTCKSYLYAASIRLDRSTMSLRDSEFDKAPMFSKNYQRPLVPFEPCPSKRY